jgi:hypothetical protein
VAGRPGDGDRRERRPGRAERRLVVVGYRPRDGYHAVIDHAQHPSLVHVVDEDEPLDLARPRVAHLPHVLAAAVRDAAAFLLREAEIAGRPGAAVNEGEVRDSAPPHCRDELGMLLDVGLHGGELAAQPVGLDAGHFAVRDEAAAREVDHRLERPRLLLQHDVGGARDRLARFPAPDQRLGRLVQAHERNDGAVVVVPRLAEHLEQRPVLLPRHRVQRVTHLGGGGCARHGAEHRGRHAAQQQRTQGRSPGSDGLGESSEADGRRVGRGHGIPWVDGSARRLSKRRSKRIRRGAGRVSRHVANTCACVANCLQTMEWNCRKPVALLWPHRVEAIRGGSHAEVILEPVGEVGDALEAHAVRDLRD